MQSYPEEAKVFVCTRDTVFQNQHYHTGDFLISNLSDLPEGFAVECADPKAFVLPVPLGLNCDRKVFELYQ